MLLKMVSFRYSQMRQRMQANCLQNHRDLGFCNSGSESHSPIQFLRELVQRPSILNVRSDPNQSALVMGQCKKRCSRLSTSLLQNWQRGLICVTLLCNSSLTGKQLVQIFQRKMIILKGNFRDHNLFQIPGFQLLFGLTCCSLTRVQYPELIEYSPLILYFHTILS